MSEAAPETSAVDTDLNALADQGFHLVVEEAEHFVIEKVDHAGTQSFVGKTLEEVIGLVKDKLASHPGAPVTVISRSDGTHESVDALATQAGRPAAPEGQSGTTPGASASSETVDLSESSANTGPGANVAQPDAEGLAAAAATEAPEEPAAEPTSESPIATEAGQVATGPIGPTEQPAAEPEPAPEGAVES